MSTLVHKNLVICFGEIEETPDAYLLGNFIYQKNTFEGAFLIQEEPPFSGVWFYTDEGDFVESVAVPIEPTPEPLPPVPSSVTPRQARLVLALQPSPDTSYPHLLALVEDAFNSLQEPQKTLAKISWEYATSIERSSDLITQMQGILGLTSEEIDNLFRQAATL